MPFSTPDILLAPLAARIERRLPPHPAWLPQVMAGVGLAGAAGAIAFHHHWIGAGLLALGLAAAALAPSLVLSLILSLGLLLLPFDGSRALAAMFLMLALTVLTVLRGGNVSAVTWVAAAGLWLAALLPDHFSLLAYLIGIMSFVAAGQGVAERRQ
jgi:hypothetical protein